MKELDVLLERYLDRRLPLAPASERNAFAALLEREDAEIWAWVMGHAQPSDPVLAGLVERMRSVHD